MKSTPDNTPSTPDFSGLSTAEMLTVIRNLKEELAAKDDILQRQLKQRDEAIERRGSVARPQNLTGETCAKGDERRAHPQGDGLYLNQWDT